MTNPVPGLTSIVYTVSPEATVRQAADLMASSNVGAVIVVKGRTPIGILTDRDIVVRVAAVGLDPRRVSVQDVMSKPVVTVSQTDELTVAVDLMERHRVRRIPVLDETGRLASMVTCDDLLVLAGSHPSRVASVIAQQLHPTTPLTLEEEPPWPSGRSSLHPSRAVLKQVVQGSVVPPAASVRSAHLPRLFRRLRQNPEWLLIMGLLSLGAALIALIVAYLLTPPAPLG
jgi:CBS domain-containing protein